MTFGLDLKPNKFYLLLRDYFMIAVGATLLALSINLFFDPLAMVTGGVTGIGVILHNTVGVKIEVVNLVLNVPLFLIGLWVLGGKFGIKTLYSTFLLTFSLWFTKLPILHWLGYANPSKGLLNPMVHDLLLAAIFGGSLAGIGLGIVFRYGSTTGGTDLAASILHKYFRHISVATLLFFLDGIIILLGIFVLGNMERSFYGIISIFVSAKMIDAMLEGVHFAKAAFIISDHSDAVAEKLMEELERGVTGLHGKGMYTKKAKNILLSVVSKQQIVKLKEITKKIDPQAFVIVADVREVLGEGFKEE